VAGGERYQVLDQLTLLFDKSLVVAAESQHGTRYRLLETVRQYAVEKLAETRGGNDARTRHRAQNLRSAAHGNVTRALQNQEDRLSGPVSQAV
jgi:predicted ATPase